jgi:hypothetical protein
MQETAYQQILSVRIRDRLTFISDVSVPYQCRPSSVRHNVTVRYILNAAIHTHLAPRCPVAVSNRTVLSDIIGMIFAVLH